MVRYVQVLQKNNEITITFTVYRSIFSLFLRTGGLLPIVKEMVEISTISCTQEVQLAIYTILQLFFYI